MSKFSITACTIFFLSLFSTGPGAETPSPQMTTTLARVEDHRQLVEMPAQTRTFMRQDMLDHMAALNEVIGLLAENKLNDAAEVAESRIGKSSMGKYRSTGMGPGRFMPLEMRNIGWGMHESASEFARIAKEGDLNAAYQALQRISGACVSCHYSYRTH